VTDPEFARMRRRMVRVVVGLSFVLMATSTTALAVLAANHALTTGLAVELGVGTFVNAIGVGLFMRGAWRLR